MLFFCKKKLLIAATLTYTLILSNSLSIFAQNADKLLKKANFFFNENNYKQAIFLYKDVLLTDNSLDAKAKLAECYQKIADYTNAEYWYKQVMSLNPNEPIYKLKYARMLQTIGRCSDAKKYFLDYGKFDILGEALAQGCDSITQFNKNAHLYNIQYLPFNTPNTEMSAMPYMQGIVFASNQSETNPLQATNPNLLELFYAEKQLGNAFMPPKKIKGGINTEFNESNPCFTPNKTQMFFTRNVKTKQANKPNVLGIFYSQLDPIQNQWLKAQPFVFNQIEYSIAYPTLSPDGQTLYFASDMPADGAQGGMDLYTCSRLDSVSWTQPINLGADVNTTADEAFPYMHTDGTLYFSSNGRAGLGGLDIFKTIFTNNKWTQPQNLGAPFNSLKDDFSIVFLSDNAQSGYFSSNRESTTQLDDIYYFEAHTETPAPIMSSLPTPQTQAYTIADTALIRQNVKIDPIYFHKGKHDITEQAATELGKLQTFLTEHPEISIELGGHTDSRASEFVNQQFGTRRAENCRNYLVERDIPPAKINTKSYGATQLANYCQTGMDCTEYQHAVNNRVEVKITEINRQKLIYPILLNPAPAELPQPQTPIYIPPTLPTNDSLPITTPTTIPPQTEPINSNTTTSSEASLLPQWNFKVYVGKHKEMTDNVLYKYKEIEPNKTEFLLEKNYYIIVLGAYNTIAEAEQIKQRVEAETAQKAKIVVFNGTEKTNKKINDLKKIGVK